MGNNRLIEFIHVNDIPSLPEAAKISINAALSEDISLEDLIEIIKNNPSLTLKVLKFANSAYYSRERKISSIKDAIVLLGFKTVKGIILSVTIKDIFKEKNSKWFDYKKYWLHLVATAVFARELSKKLSRGESELYAAGLLHDIGKAVFLSGAEEEYKKVIGMVKEEHITTSEAENRVFGFDHSDLAHFLMDKWGFPDGISDVISKHHNAGEIYGKYPSIELLILVLSNLLSNSSGFPVIDEEPQNINPEIIINKLGILQDDIDRIIMETKEELKVFASMLEIPGSYIGGIFKAISEANRKLGEMYLENRKITNVIKAEKSIIEKLNEISYFLLEERDTENILKGIAKRICAFFKAPGCHIQFHLNEQKSLFASAINPAMSGHLEEVDSGIKVMDIQEIKDIVTKWNCDVFKISGIEGKEIGVIYLISGPEGISQDIKLFLDYISLSLKNLNLRLMNELKAEKLQIAVKKLKDEIEARRKSSLLNTLIIENSPIGIVITDAGGDIILFNKNAEKLLGEDLSKKNILKDIPKISGIIREKLKTTVLRDKGLELTVKKNGYIKYLEIHYKKLAETKYHLFLVQDITTRKKNESILAEKRNMETLGELAAGIAHNLRSPLAAAKGISELMVSELEGENIRIIKGKTGKENLVDEFRENLNIISSSIEKALIIINSMMELAKEENIHSGNGQPVDIEDVIKEAYSLLEYRFKEKKVNFETDTSCNLVKGNKNMFVQIILNLLSNALDAVEEGGWIKLTCKQKDNNSILEVEDNGRGIPEEDLNRIFEPFYTTSRDATGRGIGLSITKKMVLAHGGTIKALKRPGGGTIIRIILPSSQVII